MMKMFTEMLTRKPKMRDEDIWAWARVEYKKDAAWAFAEMKENGTAPDVRAY